MYLYISGAIQDIYLQIAVSICRIQMVRIPVEEEDNG